MCSKDKEISALTQKGEEDAATIAGLQKRVKELEARIEELEEDLENERALRTRVCRFRFKDLFVKLTIILH